MKLSVAIPTHHGRRDHLLEALESIAAQVTPELPLDLELCISDNASHDGTEEMVAAFRAAHPELEVGYHRNERDVGLKNILLVVERATGDWCWLFGSDDVMAEDALARLMATIVQFPDASGVGFGKANFSHDMQRRLEADAAESLPSRRETTLLTDVEEICVELALVHCFMGSNAVRRDRWLAAAADRGPEAIAHRDWPQLVILQAMAAAHPRWVWFPAMLVKARAGAPYLMVETGGAPDLSAMHVRLTAGLQEVYGDLAGRDRGLYRRLMTRLYHSVASSTIVANLKDAPNHTLRGDLALLWRFTSAYWWLPAFRRHGLVLLLVPLPLWRALRRRQRARRGGPMRALQLTDLRAQTRAELPGRVWARDMIRVPCSARNTGSHEWRSLEPHAVVLSYRWFDAAGGVVIDGMRELLPCPVPPGHEARGVLRVLTPWEPGRYRLQIAPVQELVGWFDDADPASGVAAEYDVLPG